MDPRKFLGPLALATLLAVVCSSATWAQSPASAAAAAPVAAAPAPGAPLGPPAPVGAPLGAAPTAAAPPAASAPVAAPPPLGAPAPTAGAAAPPGAAPGGAPGGSGFEVVQLTPGDQVKMECFNRPEMATAAYVESNGTLRLPLVGAVQVGNMSPAEAARKIEQAYVDQKYLKDPHCTLSVTGSPSRVSVLGEVKNPNRYPIDGRTTVLDVLALAGGRTDRGDDSVYLLRQEASGTAQRIKIDLKGIASQDDRLPDGVEVTLRNGDRIYVPAASSFFIVGEVKKPESYRLEPGLTIQRAIALAGGVTDKGSASRIEIKRRKPNGDYQILSGKPTDKIQPDDMITIKERIF